ncbi:glycosyltransferase family 4 protein [Flavobacterium sp.]|uniref:glycosyltransferase family 4 protein n=1 Tax=Flavobacterium sp. TaxID=239 RepID=UPI0012023758|nr:glycosyltransferase family 4 protein [Flavobacterium sp.]RZJ70843.1 MAG: glycosyltransferase family 1 protein [Flavobacterium sp.]
MKASPKPKIIRTSTIPIALANLLRGQLAFLNEHFEIVAVSSPGEYLEVVSEREKVRTESVQMYRNIKPFHDLVSLWKLYRLFRREKPFLVHSITPKAGLLSMTAAWMARVPVRAHTFTGLIFPSKSGVMRTLLIAMDKILCSFATTIYPEGQGVKRDLEQFGITKKPLNVIGNGNVNGIDVDFFSNAHFSSEENRNLKTSLGISDEDFVFVFVGRIVRDKGIEELTSAFDKLSEQNPNVKLLLVGDREQDLDPISERSENSIRNNPNIISLGWQNDVRPFYAIADALAFPSYREGFPNVVMQAGAMDLPSIVTNINGCNEIVEHANNGLIIEPKDEKALFEAMKTLLENESVFLRLKANARQAIVSRYAQKALWEALLFEYERLSASQKRGIS